MRTRLLALVAGGARPVRLGGGSGGGRAGPPAPPAIGPRARVLLIRPDHLGDVLFVGPALARLRARRPDAAVTLAVGPWARAVAERLPGADAVCTLDFPWFDRRPRGAPWTPYARLLPAARRLADHGPFDAALVLRDDDYWGALLARRMQVPRRVAHDHPAVSPFATHVVATGWARAHACAAGVALVEGACGHGGPTAPPATPADAPLAWRRSEDDERRARELLGAALAAGRPGPLAVHPGSGAAVKRWRAGGWAEVIGALTAPGETVLVTGSAGEAPLAAAIGACTDRPVLDLCGRTDLALLAAVFTCCRLVLGPDSGPLHLAVAVGTPTVHLFGPADPARFGPWGPAPRHKTVTAGLPCAPCGRLAWPAVEDHPCVRAIAAADVAAAARDATSR